MSEVTPERAYMAVLHLDSAVYHKNTLIPQHTPWQPKGGEDIPLPREYFAWADSADAADVDHFWDAVDAANWREAKKISGLSPDVIGRIMTAAKASGRNRGKASPDDKYVLGIRLTRFLFITRIEASSEHARVFLRHMNRMQGPPFKALSSKQKEAYSWLASRINEEVGK